MAEPREPGRVEQAVRRDLKVMPASARDSALAEMALVMAAAMDSFALRALGGSPAELSALAKAHQELRVTLGEIREVADRDGGGDGEDQAGLSTPVWDGAAAVRDAPLVGAADVGSEGGGGGPPAG